MSDPSLTRAHSRKRRYDNFTLPSPFWTSEVDVYESFDSNKKKLKNMISNATLNYCYYLSLEWSHTLWFRDPQTKKIRTILYRVGVSITCKYCSIAFISMVISWKRLLRRNKQHHVQQSTAYNYHRYFIRNLHYLTSWDFGRERVEVRLLCGAKYKHLVVLLSLS